MREKAVPRRAGKPDAHIEAFGRKLSATSAAKKGAILLRLDGADGVAYRLGREGAVRVKSGAEPAGHVVEIIAAPERIRAILEGKKNARSEYFSGGIRVRGDVQHAIDIAFELGFIRERF